MYNEQLEQLISAAMADGLLTEKEKQILFRKAQSMGIDLDEFEMVLDARVFELSKAEKAADSFSAPKSNKWGDVKKCPQCGTPVVSGSVRCAECGHVFSNIEANSSAQRLAEKIENIERDYKERKSKAKFWERLLEAAPSPKEEICTTIAHFPIPNTREDLLEFLSSMQAKVETYKPKVNEPGGVLYNAYSAKYKECLNKSMIYFADDPAFQRFFPKEDDGKKKRGIGKFFK